VYIYVFDQLVHMTEPITSPHFSRRGWCKANAMTWKRWRFYISMTTHNTSFVSHCVTLSLKSLDALRWFSGLDQLGQGRIRLCVRLHFRILVHQQVTDNSRKHHAAPRIQMSPVAYSSSLKSSCAFGTRNKAVTENSRVAENTL
jgi:hypothetical protein